MKNHKNPRFLTVRFAAASLKVTAAAALAVAGSASAAVVWSDDFSGSTAGSAPTRDFPDGAAGNDYTIGNQTNATTLTSGAVGNPGNSLVQLDTNTGSSNSSAIATVFMDQFAPFTLSATTNLLRVRYDFRVDSFLSATQTDQAPRFILRFAATGSQQIVLGLGRGNIDDGDASEDLALFATVTSSGSSAVTPNNSSSIGLIAGTGWVPGFDFGNYSTTAADNDTSDQFYRYDFTYDFNSGDVLGTVTNTVTAESAAFSRSMQSGLAFSNSSDRSILFATGGSSQSTSYFDNIEISAVPEPSVAVLGGLPLFGLAARRRR